MKIRTEIRFLYTSLFIILLLFLPGSIHSKAKSSVSEAQVFQISEQEPIKVDGLLTESVWQNAPPIGPLTMVEPDEGVPPSMDTEVRVVVDSQSIYFGIMCFDSDPEKIVSYTMQRDAQLRGEDHVKIVLDTFLNGRTGYIFAVNPNGARYDGLIEREGEGENR